MTAPAATRRVHVIQGEYTIAREPDVVLTTILGSCVAACLRDPAAGVGGMNHFLLPGTSTSSAQGAAAARYGVYLMELLINELLKNGARRDNLEAKIFGGAQTMSSFSNVGQQNADFAKQFLADEGIRIVNASTGGAHGRKLEYWPVSGRARQYALNNQDLLRSAEIERPRVPPPPIDNSVEFF
jgi:chemotaxis protein CheD